MPKITIELELGPGYEQDQDGDFYPTDREAFDEQIAQRVADNVYRGAEYAVRERLGRAVKERTDKEIDRQVGALIADVIANPLRTYDYDGKPKGEPFTVRELVVQAVQQFATNPSGRRDSYSSSKGPTNLAEIVDDVVSSAMQGELKDDVIRIRQAVAAEIKERLTGAAVAAITTPRR